MPYQWQTIISSVFLRNLKKSQKQSRLTFLQPNSSESTRTHARARNLHHYFAPVQVQCIRVVVTLLGVGRGRRLFDLDVVISLAAGVANFMRRKSPSLQLRGTFNALIYAPCRQNASRAIWFSLSLAKATSCLRILSYCADGENEATYELVVLTVNFQD